VEHGERYERQGVLLDPEAVQEAECFEDAECVNASV
jgi:hypothetical protein